MVITRAVVYDGAGNILHDERIDPAELMEYSSGLPVTFSKRDRWVSYDNGERSWMASGLSFVVERTELP